VLLTSVVTEGEVRPATPPAASIGEVVSTPEKAEVTMDTWVGGSIVAPAVVWEDVAIPTHTATRVPDPSITSTALLDPLLQPIDANGYVSTTLTMASPAAVPAGSAVVGLPELPEAVEVGLPTMEMAVLPAEELVPPPLEPPLPDCAGNRAIVTATGALGGGESDHFAVDVVPAEPAVSRAIETWEFPPSLTVAARVDPRGAPATAFQVFEPSPNKSSSPPIEVVTAGELSVVE
jgi:hypothetical protein